MSEATLSPGAGNPSVSAALAPSARLNYRIAVGWGLGWVTLTAVDFAKILLLSYLVDYVGMAAFIAAAMIAISKFFDALIDPYVGVVSDGTQSVWGRRRPYLFIGALACGGAYFMMFHVPQWTSSLTVGVYVFVSLMIYATAYALFSVAHKAMAAEITDNYNARTTLMSIGTVFFMLGAAAGSSTAPVLISVFGGGRLGHEAMSAVMGLSVAVVGLVCFAMTAGAPSRAPTPATSRAKGREIWSLILKNRPFFILTLSSLFRGLSVALMNGSAVFYVRRVLGVGDVWLGQFFLVVTASCVLSLPGWMWISHRVGKKNAFLLGCALFIPAQLSWFWATATEPAWILFIRTVAVGLASGSLLATSQSMLPDTIDFDRRQTGLNREGIYAGFTTTVDKVTVALGVALVGVVLGLTHYVKSTTAQVIQPRGAIDGIYFCFATAPTILMLLSGLVMLAYPLTETSLNGMDDRSIGGARVAA